jgi:uncharacterized membrane protein YdbT with pleckstrin-like domain
MSYIKNNLSSKENVIQEAKVSKIYVFIRPILIVGLPVWFICSRIPDENAVLGIITCGILLLISMIFRGIIILLTTEIALTNQRVIMKWGLIKRNTIETFLDKVEGIKVNQSLFGRFLNYGSVAISGTGGNGTPAPGISSPVKFRNAVNEFIQNRNNTM